MSAPPQIIRVKRKATDEAPVSFLRMEPRFREDRVEILTACRGRRQQAPEKRHVRL